MHATIATAVGVLSRKRGKNSATAGSMPRHVDSGTSQIATSPTAIGSAIAR